MNRILSATTALRALQLVTSDVLMPSVQARALNTKHWNPKWKKLRKLKIAPVDLPDFHEDESKLPERIKRQRMIEKNVPVIRPWKERDQFISCTGSVFEAYVPPEGDGKLSVVSKDGVKQQLRLLEKKSRSMMAIRKIRSYEEDFDYQTFANQAQQIYIDAHHHLITGDENMQLIEHVTERCFPEFTYNTLLRTIRWKFLKEIEPPRVVQARVTDVVTSNNLFAQITVRLHTQQSIAVYDRFGRLIYGDENEPKASLEYVVFEKHISNEYGKWRVHQKIIPDWMPPKEPTMLTYVHQRNFKPREVGDGMIKCKNS